MLQIEHQLKDYFFPGIYHNHMMQQLLNARMSNGTVFAAKESANSQINETVLGMLLNCISTAVPCAEGIPDIFLLCGSQIYIEVNCDNTVIAEEPD